MKRFFVFATAVSMVTPLHIGAQQEADAKASFQPADDGRIVISATRLKNETESEMASSRFTLDDLNLTNSQHLNELTQWQPAVWITKGNGQEHLTAIRSPVFTGPGSCAEFLMMENGIPVRANGFCNVNQLFDTFQEQATGFEIYRGTYSAWYGSDAVHGVINVNSLQLPLVNQGNDHFRSRATIGDYGFQSLDARIAEDNQAFTISGKRDAGVKRASGFDQQKVQYERIDESDSLGVHSVIAINNLNQETAGYLQQGFRAYANEANLLINEFPEAFRESQSIRASTRISSVTSDQWTVTPYFRSHDMEFLMHFLPGQPIEENGQDSVGIMADFKYVLGGWDLTSGFDLEITEAFLKQTQSQATDSGVAFLDAVLPQGKHYDFVVDSIYLAAFYGAQYALSSNEQIAAALRVDYLNYDYDNQMLDGRTRDDGSSCSFGGCRYTRPSDRSDSFTDPSFNLSYTQQLNSSEQVRIKLDRGFRAPQATELYRLQNGQTTAELDSQAVTSFEFGWQYQSEQLSSHITVFAMNKSNVIYQNSDREWVYDAKTEHRGLEASIGYQINNAWRIDLNGTFARHKYANNPDITASNIEGNDMDTAPRRMGSVRLSYSANNGDRYLLQAQRIGSHYLDPENLRRYAGHNLINFYYQTELVPKLDLSIKVLNITDERYADRADFAFGNYRYFVGEPRRAFVSFSYNY